MGQAGQASGTSEGQAGQAGWGSIIGVGGSSEVVGWRSLSCRNVLVCSDRPPVAVRACCCVSRLLVPPVPPMSRLKRACPAQQVARFLENRGSHRKSDTLKLRNDRFSQRSCSQSFVISTVEGWGACPAASRSTVFCHGGTGAWKIGAERVGGRSASATSGVRVGIHDTEGINTLLALRKA